MKLMQMAVDKNTLNNSFNYFYSEKGRQLICLPFFVEAYNDYLKFNLFTFYSYF